MWPIKEVMVKTPVTVTRPRFGGQSDSIDGGRGGYRRLPIVDEAGRPVGILGSVGHPASIWSNIFRNVIYTLPPTATPSTQEREGA